MAKYIDVESLVVAYDGHTPDDEFSQGVDFVLDLLDSKPPADVRLVVLGCWVFNEEDGHCYCSECGGVSPMDDQNGDECDCPNYCPNCGADMREREEKPKKDPFDGWSEELKETYRKLLASLHSEGGDAE